MQKIGDVSCKTHLNAKLHKTKKTVFQNGTSKNTCFSLFFVFFALFPHFLTSFSSFFGFFAQDRKKPKKTEKTRKNRVFTGPVLSQLTHINILPGCKKVCTKNTPFCTHVLLDPLKNPKKPKNTKKHRKKRVFSVFLKKRVDFSDWFFQKTVKKVTFCQKWLKWKNYYEKLGYF